MFAPKTSTGAANARVKVRANERQRDSRARLPRLMDDIVEGRRSLMSIVMLIGIILVQKANNAVDSLGAEMSGGGPDEHHCHIRVRNV
jgi:hypothetical protein